MQSNPRDRPSFAGSCWPLCGGENAAIKPAFIDGQPCAAGAQICAAMILGLRPKSPVAPTSDHSVRPGSRRRYRINFEHAKIKR